MVEQVQETPGYCYEVNKPVDECRGRCGKPEQHACDSVCPEHKDIRCVDTIGHTGSCAGGNGPNWPNPRPVNEGDYLVRQADRCARCGHEGLDHPTEKACAECGGECDYLDAAGPGLPGLLGQLGIIEQAEPDRIPFDEWMALDEPYLVDPAHVMALGARTELAKKAFWRYSRGNVVQSDLAFGEGSEKVGGYSHVAVAYIHRLTGLFDAMQDCVLVYAGGGKEPPGLLVLKNRHVRAVIAPRVCLEDRQVGCGCDEKQGGGVRDL